MLFLLSLFLQLYSIHGQLRLRDWQTVLDQEMSSLAGAGEAGVSEVARSADIDATRFVLRVFEAVSFEHSLLRACELDRADHWVSAVV